MRERHTFEPVYDTHSKILILGTFPSVKSRESGFYYGHPRNRFWRVMSDLTSTPFPESIEEKKEMLLKNHIAVWDVIASCDIVGSRDSSIRDVVPNEIAPLFSKTEIGAVYGNGVKACQLYDRYMREQTGREIVRLPSTSPANAAYPLERLESEWREKITQFYNIRGI